MTEKHDTDKADGNPGDNGEAWEINGEPRDKPEWLGEDVHSRSGGEYEGEAWRINENTSGDGHDKAGDEKVGHDKAGKTGS